MQKTTSTNNRHILLVPGVVFPSPGMRLLQTNLKREFQHVEVYRHPQRIGNVRENIAALEQRLLEIDRTSRKISLVTHGFGDWVVRQVINDRRRGDSELTCPRHLVSIAPVVTSHPLAKLASLLTAGNFSEFEITSQAAYASEYLRMPGMLRHIVIWAKLDLWVRRRSLPSYHTQQRKYWATHHSAVIQPNIHRLIREYLLTETVDPEAARVDHSVMKLEAAAAMPVASSSISEPVSQ